MKLKITVILLFLAGSFVKANENTMHTPSKNDQRLKYFIINLNSSDYKVNVVELNSKDCRWFKCSAILDHLVIHVFTR